MCQWRIEIFLINCRHYATTISLKRPERLSWIWMRKLDKRTLDHVRVYVAVVETTATPIQLLLFISIQGIPFPRNEGELPLLEDGIFEFSSLARAGWCTKYPDNGRAVKAGVFILQWEWLKVICGVYLHVPLISHSFVFFKMYDARRQQNG